MNKTFAVSYISGSDNIPGPMPRNLRITGKGVTVFGLLSKYKETLPWDVIQRADIKHFAIDDTNSTAMALLVGVPGVKRTGSSILITYKKPSGEIKVLVIETNFIHTVDNIKRTIDKQLLKKFGTVERVPLARTVEKPSNPVDKIASLEKLSALRKDGTLTEAEFQEQKTSLLN